MVWFSQKLLLDVESREHMAWTTNGLVEKLDVRTFSGLYFVELSQGTARTVVRLAVQ